jgi:hypothetical protein
MAREREEEEGRVFKGREEFGSNLIHALVALGIWLGTIHFNIALLLISLLFLPLSKLLLSVFFLPQSIFF